MEYIDLCKAIFIKEVVDWEMRKVKCRKRQLVQARQICMFFGNWFYPQLTSEQLVIPFKQDRCSASHAMKSVKDQMSVDKNFKAKIERYALQLRSAIDTSNNVEVWAENDFFTN